MAKEVIPGDWWKEFKRQLAAALRKSQFEEKTKADIQANLLRFERQLKRTYDDYLKGDCDQEEFRAYIIGILIKIFRRVGVKLTKEEVKATKEEIYGMDYVFKSISAWLKRFLEQRPLRREAT